MSPVFPDARSDVRGDPFVNITGGPNLLADVKKKLDAYKYTDGQLQATALAIILNCL